MKLNEFEKRLGNSRLPKYSFVNEHGEMFSIWMSDVAVYIAGDETDGEVINLFNEDFSIYSREELAEIGKALINLSEHRILKEQK